MTTTPISEKSDLISHSTVFYEKEGQKLSFCYELFQQTVGSGGKITEKRVYLPREEWENVVNPKIKETLEKTAVIGSKVLAPKEIKFSESRTSVVSPDGSTDDSASDQKNFFKTIKPKISYDPPRPVEKPRPAPVTLSPTLVARPAAPPDPTPPVAPAVPDAGSAKPPAPPGVPEKAPAPPAAPAKTLKPSAPPALVPGKPLSTETAFKIHNAGNDCFINSFLHMILSNPELTKAIVETEDENLSELINFLTQKPKKSGWFGRGPEDALTGSKSIRTCLHRLSPTAGFSGSVQHDSFEAYTLLMNYLSEKHSARFEPFLCTQTTTRETTTTSLSPHPAFPKLTETAPPEIAPKRFALIDPFKKDSLQETVNSYFSSQETQREPRVRLDKTRTTVRFDKAPEQLNINLKEKHGSPSVAKMTGIEEFSLSSRLHGGTERSVGYSLVGFSVYTGDAKTGKSGHWYSYRKIGKRYYKLNDSTVRECSQHEFLETASASARHLVYRKKT